MLLTHKIPCFLQELAGKCVTSCSLSLSRGEGFWYQRRHLDGYRMTESNTSMYYDLAAGGDGNDTRSLFPFLASESLMTRFLLF